MYLFVCHNNIHQGVWRWFDDEMLDCCGILDIIKEKGITLHQLGSVASCNGADAALRYGPDMTVEEFRRIVQISCARSDEIKTVLIASYARWVYTTCNGIMQYIYVCFLVVLQLL
jgi:glutathione gamma-glutamylcysteinyltransferase